jgi:hypothetical protein
MVYLIGRSDTVVVMDGKVKWLRVYGARPGGRRTERTPCPAGGLPRRPAVGNLAPATAMSTRRSSMAMACCRLTEQTRKSEWRFWGPVNL